MEDNDSIHGLVGTPCNIESPLAGVKSGEDYYRGRAVERLII